MMREQTPKPAVDRVEEALRRAGLVTEIVEFPVSTRTAADAASAVGTTVGQIVKSLVFMVDGTPVLVLTSGSNRVDTAGLSRRFGKDVRKATADEVRAATGFAIGGVAPLGHPVAHRLMVLVDRDLLHYEVLYAAAGTPNAVFPITPADLLGVSGGEPADVRADGAAP
ncbi:MAG: YbaK/EbsC family protein [Chloroflexota bacterium]